MRLIDTHAHLYSEEFDGDLASCVERARNEGVGAAYLPNIDLASTERLDKLSEDYPGFFRPMMGLHPCSVKENYKEELARIREKLYSDPEKYAGIGETGVDHYWDRNFDPQQEEAFKEQIRWAAELDKPVIIHSRESLDLNIRIVEDKKKSFPDLKGIFHCFNGNEEQAMKIRSLGFLLGIGGVITYKNAGMDISLKGVPLDCMVLETDAPYLAPVPFRGKRNEPSYLRYIADRLAAIKGVSTGEVAEKTTENALKLFET